MERPERLPFKKRLLLNPSALRESKSAHRGDRVAAQLTLCPLSQLDGDVAVIRVPLVAHGAIAVRRVPGRKARCVAHGAFEGPPEGG
jgi:hypothetical protein